MRRLAILTAWCMGACADSLERADAALASLEDPSERLEVIRELDASDDPRRLFALLRTVIERDGNSFPIDAALRKLGEITGPPDLIVERDRYLHDLVRRSPGPWVRAAALEVLMRPEADRTSLLDAFVWCVATFPDPGVACHGFGEHASQMRDAGPPLFAAAAERGDPILTYYAARFACEGHGTTLDRAAREAVRDTLQAARAAGFSDGYLATCSRSLALMLRDPTIAFEARAPCPPKPSPGAPPVDANRPER